MSFPALLGFDTETTGVNPAADRVVTAALVEQRGADFRTRTWLADPGIEIPEAAARVHGISTERARSEGRPAGEVVTEVLDLLERAARAGVPIVIYNALFDLPLIEAEAVRHGVPPLCERLGRVPLVIDPLVVDRWVAPYRKGKRTLGALAAVHGVETHETLHDAGADVRQTLALWAALVDAHPQLASMDADQLMEEQARAHRTWAESFNRWLASRGRTPDVSPTWPIPDPQQVKD